MRSITASAASIRTGSWVAASTAVPSAAARARAAVTYSACASSCWEVGSSSTTSGRSATRHRARATRCRSPPDSTATARPRTASDRARRAPGRHLCGRGAGRGRCGPARGSPRRRAARPARRPAGRRRARPAQSARRAGRAPPAPSRRALQCRVGVGQPQQDAQQLVLPDPEGPRTTVSAPARDVGGDARRGRRARRSAPAGRMRRRPPRRACEPAPPSSGARLGPGVRRRRTARSGRPARRPAPRRRAGALAQVLRQPDPAAVVDDEDLLLGCGRRPLLGQPAVADPDDPVGDRAARASWLTTSSVAPARVAAPASRSYTASAADASRSPVGSSARTTAGRCASAAQTAIRCASPPESVDGARSASSPSRTESRSSPAARRAALRRVPARRNCSATLSRTSSSGRSARAGVLVDDAQAGAAQPGSGAFVGAGEVDAGHLDRARAGGLLAHQDLQQRRLARAVGPVYDQPLAAPGRTTTARVAP